MEREVWASLLRMHLCDLAQDKAEEDELNLLVQMEECKHQIPQQTKNGPRYAIFKPFLLDQTSVVFHTQHITAALCDNCKKDCGKLRKSQTSRTTTHYRDIR